MGHASGQIQGRLAAAKFRIRGAGGIPAAPIGLAVEPKRPDVALRHTTVKPTTHRQFIGLLSVVTP